MGKLNIGVLGDSLFNNEMVMNFYELVMKMMNKLIKFSEILGL
jgi:hypothetical protein